MNIVVCGVNYKTAPIELREKLARLSVDDSLKAILQLPAVNEALLLNTCNRSEIYAAQAPSVADTNVIAQWLLDVTQADLKHFYYYRDEAAITHILRVAVGLDSLVLGEPQILGQMKQAFAHALGLRALGGTLGRWMQTVFSASKVVRSHTEIGRHPVSIAYAALNISQRIFADLSKARLLFIGAGQTTALAAMHFANAGCKRIMIANRDLARAQALAQRLHAKAISLADIAAYLPEVDIVLSATASDLPIIGKGMVESALKVGKRRPMLMIDVAMPRDIEPEVGKLPDVYLYHLDDLENIIQANLRSRQTAAEQAEAMIAIQVAHFMRQMQALSVVDSIKAYRQKIKVLENQQLESALQQLDSGTAPKQVLAQALEQFANRLMHGPTVQMRQAALDGEHDKLLFAKDLLEL